MLKMRYNCSPVPSAQKHCSDNVDGQITAAILDDFAECQHQLPSKRP